MSRTSLTRSPTRSYRIAITPSSEESVIKTKDSSDYYNSITFHYNSSFSLSLSLSLSLSIRIQQPVPSSLSPHILKSLSSKMNNLTILHLHYSHLKDTASLCIQEACIFIQHYGAVLHDPYVICLLNVARILLFYINRILYFIYFFNEQIIFNS